jgi:hypothetical protein
VLGVAGLQDVRACKLAAIVRRAGQLADARGGSRELVARNLGEHLGRKVALGLGLIQQDQASFA